MRNLKVSMAYDGTAYHGFQSQNNAVTIQDVVQERMSQLLNQRVIINGCSRTDAGVHAKQFFFSSRIDNTITCDGFIKAMNALLPPDISVLSCEDADDDFHACFCAKGKEYLYLVYNAPLRNVFNRDLALFYPLRIDEQRLDRAAKLFVGTHDFAAFCKAESKEHLETTVRTITDFRVVRNGDYVEFYVSGNGFLHNMVRILIGTLIYVNENKRGEADIIASIETGERDKAGKTLPPCGLYLNKVFY